MPYLRSYTNSSVVKVKKELPSHFKQVASSSELGIEFEGFLDEEFDEEFDDDDDSDHFQPIYIGNDFISFVPIYQQHKPKHCWDYLSRYSKELYLRNRNLRL
jgi:hypothetical protein